MRVLLVTRSEHVAAHVRLLAHLGAGLLERGADVGYLTRPANDVQRVFQHIGETAWAFAFATPSPFGDLVAARRTILAFQPDVVITDTESDALLVALAGRNRVGIVRRWRIDETDGAHWTWRSRLASRLSRMSVLLPFGSDTMEFPPRVRVVRASVSLPAPSGGLQEVIEGTTAPLAIACLTDSDNMSTALCLRTVSKLRTRHPGLTLVLLGRMAQLQPARVHAAALGLTDGVRVMPPSALFDNAPLDCVALWVATDGDEGALAAVAAMTRAIPVVVDRNSAVAAQVAHRLTGLHADSAELAPTVAAIAQWIADPVSFRSACEASRARAQRFHSWQAFLDRVVEAIELTRGNKKAVAPGAAIGASA